MAKKKNVVGDDDVKPIELPEEEDDKILPLSTEDGELLDDDDMDEEDEEVEDEGDSF